MANSNGWGDGAANNSIGWGQGANNNIGWGKSHSLSSAGLTDIVGLDSSASAFISAAGITDATQISAINNLVVGMKADGIWTKMKAIYPFVGGTATTHKYNLKDPRDLDAAFRLVFNGGWTHSSNGATPNGTNGYADTKLVPSSVLTPSNFAHLSYYSNSNTQKSFEYVMGGNDLVGSLGLISRRNTNLQYFISSNTGATYEIASNTSATTGAGFLLGTQLASTIKLFRSNVLQASNTTLTTSLGVSSKKIYLGAANDNDTSVVGYTDKLCSFSTIGNGLTDTEAAALYNSVNTYQVALSRNV